MASLLPECLFEVGGQGPPPNKDFYYLSVTKSHVIWRWWRISLRSDRNAKPGEARASHQDYLEDSRLQSQIRMVFGRRILHYTLALCQGFYDYLERLPDPLLLRVLAYLELEDVGQLARTSRRFRKLCGSEEFWEQTVRRRCDTISTEVTSLAAGVGWRSVFFTSKLQLQKQISRLRQRAKREQGVEPRDWPAAVAAAGVLLREPPAPTPCEVPETVPSGDGSGAEAKPCGSAGADLNFGTDGRFDGGKDLGSESSPNSGRERDSYSRDVLTPSLRRSSFVMT